MDKWEVVISAIGVFVSGVAFSFAVFKYAFGGYIGKLSAEIAANNESIKRIDKDRHECRTHCDKERKDCQVANRKEYQRIYDKIEGRND